MKKKRVDKWGIDAKHWQYACYAYHVPTLEYSCGITGQVPFRFLQLERERFFWRGRGGNRAKRELHFCGLGDFGNFNGFSQGREGGGKLPHIAGAFCFLFLFLYSNGEAEGVCC